MILTKKQYLNKPPSIKQKFKYFISYKDSKDISPSSIFFPEMDTCKRYSDKTECMHFMIKDGTFFDKYMKTQKKVGNIIKKVNSQLIYNKKYLKAENKFNTQKNFECFYMPVILIYSVYRKD